MRKEDHLLHSQVPLKCRLHRPETSSSCCSKAVLLSPTLPLLWSKCYFAKKKRYSGEIASLNTSRGLSTLDSRNFNRSPLQSEVQSHLLQSTERPAWPLVALEPVLGTGRPDSSAEELKWVRRRRGFSWDGERCWQVTSARLCGQRRRQFASDKHLVS